MCMKQRREKITNLLFAYYTNTSASEVLQLTANWYSSHHRFDILTKLSSKTTARTDISDYGTLDVSLTMTSSQSSAALT